jgi:hypothetical protein
LKIPAAGAHDSSQEDVTYSPVTPPLQPRSKRWEDPAAVYMTELTPAPPPPFTSTPDS